MIYKENGEWHNDREESFKKITGMRSGAVFDVSWLMIISFLSQAYGIVLVASLTSCMKSFNFTDN